MNLEIQKIIMLNKKVQDIEDAIFDFDYSPKKNPDLDEQLKNIYVSLQAIKKLIGENHIDYQGVRVW